MSETGKILGYDVYRGSAEQCAADIVAAARAGGSARTLACLNPHSYAVARGDERFRRALHAADWLLPDGAGIIVASRLLGSGIRERIAGPDSFERVCENSNATGGARMFFLGSTPETLALISERMAARWPQIDVVGTYSPPFKPEFDDADVEAMITAVNEARPEFLWVGLTAPKQERLIERMRDRLEVPFAAGIGAAFDFFAGRVARSHPVFRRMGLEWLPRLLQEPRRLWRRTFISGPIFLMDVIRVRLGLARQ